MNNFVSALGIIVFCIIAWAISSNRKKISWRPVAAGIILQLIIALIVFQAPGSRDFFVFLSDLVNRTIEASREGVEFVFGDLGNRFQK